MMMKKFALAGVVAAVIAFPSVAGADSLDTLTLTGLGNGAWVNLHLNLTGESFTGWAGEIKWLLKTPTDSVGTAITTYCVDLYDDALTTQYPVAVKTTNDLTSATSIQSLPYAGVRAAYLDNKYSTGATTSASAAGLQLAIWEVMFGSAAFTYSSSDPVLAGAIGGFVTTFYNDVMGKNPTTLTNVATYYDVDNTSRLNGQDQMLVGTPEPGQLLLLTLAMTGLFASQRRRLKRSVVGVFSGGRIAKPGLN
jgi:hypothetical protein